jgi:hypothetical protein
LKEQVVPQFKPSGDDVTTPLPVPAFCTVIDGPVGGGVVAMLNAALTVAAAFIVTVHAPVPLQAPVQPAKVEPLVAAGVSVTSVAWLKLALHVAPQLIPAGALVTVPLPVPLRVTLSRNCGGGAAAVNVAVALNAEFIVSEQLDPTEPAQAPPHAVNEDPLAGVAVRVTIVP